MWKQKTWENKRKKAQAKKTKKLWDNTHPLAPNPHPDINQTPFHPPTYSMPPIIHNNNTMDTEFLVQMRECNKCGSIRNDEIFNLHLGSGVGPWVSIPLPPARHQPHLLISSAQTINQKKAKNPEMRFNSQQIVEYCLDLCTQNSGLREVDFEPSPKRGSDKINMLK